MVDIGSPTGMSIGGRGYRSPTGGTKRKKRTPSAPSSPSWPGLPGAPNTGWTPPSWPGLPTTPNRGWPGGGDMFPPGLGPSLPFDPRAPSLGAPTTGGGVTGGTTVKQGMGGGAPSYGPLGPQTWMGGGTPQISQWLKQPRKDVGFAGGEEGLYPTTFEEFGEPENVSRGFGGLDWNRYTPLAGTEKEGWRGSYWPWETPEGVGVIGPGTPVMKVYDKQTGRTLWVPQSLVSDRELTEIAKGVDEREGEGAGKGEDEEAPVGGEGGEYPFGKPAVDGNMEVKGGWYIWITRDADGNIVDQTPMGKVEAEDKGYAQPEGDTPKDNYGRSAYWDANDAQWRYPPNWNVDPETLKPGYTSPYEQWQMGEGERGRTDAAEQARLEREESARQHEANLVWYREQEENRLAAEKEERLAELRANPQSWLEYAMLSGQEPAVQPWMLPLGYEDYGFELGQPIPGWPEGGEGDLSGLPELMRPSAQYWARMNPSSRAQYMGYRGARTGMTPADIEAKMWGRAPGGYGGLRQLRYQR